MLDFCTIVSASFHHILDTASRLKGIILVDYGKRCIPNTSFTADDGCNTCRCSAYGSVIGCTRKACVQNRYKRQLQSMYKNRRKVPHCMSRSSLLHLAHHQSAFLHKFCFNLQLNLSKTILRAETHSGLDFWHKQQRLLAPI